MELVPIDAGASLFVTRIPDLDTPLRRIFPLDRLLDIIRSGEMTLVSPSHWDDPHEDPPARGLLIGFPNLPERVPRQLADYLAPAWAQCWSLNPGSDTLLRAYSSVRPDENTKRNSDRVHEGVTVTTTVRQLVSAARCWHEAGADAHVVIGRVEYHERSEIAQRVVNACNGERGPEFFCTVQGRAESLMWKRDYFSHEQEVRLLLIDRAFKHDAPRPSRRAVKVDPNALFTAISVDPRLVAFEAREREREIKDAGYGGEIKADTSYLREFWQVQMLRDWVDP